MIQFEIYSELLPWKAPRFARGHAYDPIAKQKEHLRWQIRGQYRGEILTCPVSIDFTFYFPIPKATSKTRKRQMLAGIIVPMSSPDATNLQKAMEDCLQGIVIENDRQTVDISSKRRFGETPGAVIRIMSYQEKYGVEANAD